VIDWERVGFRHGVLLRRALPYIIIFVVALAFGAIVAAEPRITVLDGDTVRSDGITYRLVGFDTPETGDRARCPAEAELGRAASARLRGLIDAGPVVLDPVPCACSPGTEGTRLCNFGRRCARLTVGGKDVGEILIGQGLARRYACSATRCPARKAWC